MAELTLDPAPNDEHTQVPERDEGAVWLASSVPPNEHVTFAPPMPPGWKLAMPVVVSNVHSPHPASSP
jgi:hypothetical protein